MKCSTPVADDWTPILNTYSKQLDDLEFQVFDPNIEYDGVLEGLHNLKRQLREASKSIESLNTVTMRLLKPNERLISEGVMRYFSDLNQLSLALVKRANNYASGATSARDSYLSNISLQLAESNAQLTEVMTTLTIIGAIMLPLDPHRRNLWNEQRRLTARIGWRFLGHHRNHGCFRMLDVDLLLASRLAQNIRQMSADGSRTVDAPFDS